MKVFKSPLALLFLILAASALLLFYRINELMPFIGDQAWFYLSARDVLTEYRIPLVGITASHTWLHQGPLWTYVLAVVLFLTKFNVLGPAVFTIIGTLITSFLMYWVSVRLFSIRTALIAASLFSFSPLVILGARMPYHTTLIPLFVLLLYYSLVMFLKGNKKFFPIIFLILSILYNLELATMVLGVLVLGIISYGVFFKKSWIKKITNRRSITTASIFLVIPLLPILFYDVTHGFPQTVLFAGWIGYRIFQAFFPLNTGLSDGHSYLDILLFLYKFNGRLLISINSFVALALVIAGITKVIYSIRQKQSSELIVLLLFVLVPLFGIFLNKTPSEAYLPIFYTSVILLVSFFISSLTQTITRTLIILVFLTLVIFLNSQWLLSNNYLIGKDQGYGVPLTKRIEIAETLVKEANGKRFSIEEKGIGEKYENTILNSMYLTWLLGNEAQKEDGYHHFETYETSVSLSIRRIK